MTSLKGKWALSVTYNKSDVVTITIFDKIYYYICAISHVSDELINPKNIEEIYWIKINDMKPIVNLSNVFYEPIDSIDELLAQIPLLKQPSSPSLSITKKQKNIELSKDELVQHNKDEKLKRKLNSIEDNITLFKKKRKLEDSVLDMKHQIMLLNVDMETKTFLLDKYDNLKKLGSSDLAKGKVWLKTVLNIPFGKHIPFKVKNKDPFFKINNYFDNIRKHLDKKIHNMDNVKDEIMEFLARKISNPNSKGHVLALCGPPGTAKTKIIKTLGEALELPFHQINFGGLNDVSVLTGHSETYISSKPGKFIEMLTSAGCMNPIFYFDEIDKLSDSKSREINGILTHVLDEEQNDKFQDNYLSNIPIDMSKVFFVLSFNEPEKIDPIVLNRMKIIYIEPPSKDDKVIIAATKMIPDIIDLLNIKKDKYINLDEELLKYIVYNKVPKEDGVRQLRKCLEKIFNKINYLLLTGKYKQKDNLLKITKDIINDLNDTISLLNIDNNSIEVVNITKTFIDNCLESNDENTQHMNMYV
jgi:ATP-dependent Lon protease